LNLVSGKKNDALPLLLLRYWFTKISLSQPSCIA
jgi:hypothetical protein